MTRLQRLVQAQSQALRRHASTAAGHATPAGAHHVAPPPKSLPAPHVSFAHRFWSKALGATMWFWLFYRAKQDGPALFGYKKPWEH